MKCRRMPPWKLASKCSDRGGIKLGRNLAITRVTEDKMAASRRRVEKAPEDRRSPKPRGQGSEIKIPAGFGLRLSAGALTLNRAFGSGFHYHLSLLLSSTDDD